MASNLDSVMTRDEAIEIFDNEILTDAMCKDGQISDWQYENGTHPPSCER